jgi:hypothetical protein
MSVKELILPNGRGAKRDESLELFASSILKLNEQASQAMSSRGWCYFIEGFGLITKGQFGKVQKGINECRKKGYLPIDMVAEDPKRTYVGIEIPERRTPEQYLKRWLEGAMEAEEYYTPDWWEGEKYYIQMMVEKIDLVNMFEPICKKYHVPIVNAGGWYDIMERAQAAFRFKEIEKKGVTPVILYCGDFDPYGLAISNFLHKNFYEIMQGTHWNPRNLIVDRFGLNHDFIVEHNLTWIDNLESGSGKDMALMDNRIVQDYIAQYGVRKCEANAIMRASARDAGIELCRDTIEKYYGQDVLFRFEDKRRAIRDRLSKFKSDTGLDIALSEALRIIEEAEG